MKPIQCKRYDCLDCRHNRYAENAVDNCRVAKFSRLYNLTVARLQYKEEQFYYPPYFRWQSPTEVINHLKSLVGHRVIILGADGDIRTGTLIAPNSAPTRYIVSGRDIWFRYSRNPDFVVVYPLTSITAIIDVDDYKKQTHRHRVIHTPEQKYELVEQPDLPF